MSESIQAMTTSCWRPVSVLALRLDMLPCRSLGVSLPRDWKADTEAGGREGRAGMREGMMVVT